MMHPSVRLIAGLAGAVLAAALFAAPASAASVINPFARTPALYMPPAGVTLTEGVRTHALMLQASLRTDPRFLRQMVAYRTQERAGTIVVNTGEKYLYLVLGDGWALRYGIGVARDGFEWSGTHRITARRKWPDWTPPAEMLKRQPGIPTHMAGGKNNPLGARALYIGATLYRIHGTNQPWTIGHNVSSGCIRMTNADVIDLYARVKIGAKVVVL